MDNWNEGLFESPFFAENALFSAGADAPDYEDGDEYGHAYEDNDGMTGTCTCMRPWI